MASKTNETDAACKRCEADIEPGMGTRANSYEDTYLCPACAAERDREDAARRARQQRQCALALGLLPTAQKLGAVVAIHTGVDQYDSSFRVEVNGHLFQVMVTEVERD